ncbi:MAG TPA: hypothetical protein VG734_12575 [Lacunisphaera sp.]|nr:hypothetical protein [Lacunisphaera sp.]
MPTLLNRVRPGDMITADQWNLVVDAVNQLLQQPSAGPAPGVTITGLVPAGSAAEPIRVGALLQIVGQNFGYNLGRTSVRFTGPSGGSAELLAADLQLGSSDTRLLLAVPGIPGVTTSNTAITLTINNGTQSVVQTLTAVVPSTPLTGDIFVSWRSGITNPNPNPVLTNGQADFAFRLQSATNQRATFALSATFTSASAAIPPGLVSSLQFFNETGTSRLNPATVDLQVGEVRNVIVRIPVIPSTWNSATFTLQLTATSGAVTNSASSLITVGTTTPQNDPAIDVQKTGEKFYNLSTGSLETDPTKATFQNGTIKLRAGYKATLEFNVRASTAGTYDLSFTAKDTATVNWTPQLVNSPAQIPGDPSQTPLIKIGVSAAATSSATGVAVFRIKRQGATVEWVQEFPVELLP